MRLVVDTNIIMAALIKDSLARRILTHIDAELLSIRFSDRELEKYKGVLLKKSGVDEKTLMMILNSLQNHLVLLEDVLIQTKMPEAAKIMDTIDPNDTPFIAAALATKSAIWSDDRHFSKQKRVKIFQTEDLVRFV